MGKHNNARPSQLQMKAAAAVAAITKGKAENPFDKFSNARKKHEVLNRKVKGEDRNVGRARAKAIDERKKKLLTDFQASKKSSVVIDRRFGENDPTMSLEEKMFLRLQKEKLRKVSRNMAQYNLDDDAQDNAVLTHKGQILGESNLDDRVNSSDDEEDTGKLGRDVVNRLHFGGGLVPAQSRAIKGSGDNEEEQQPKKGRLEALQEIVMKSKLHKIQRKEMREEMDNERERLDAEFDALLTGSLVDFDPNGATGRRGRKEGETVEESTGDAYDKSVQAMMYETRRQPGERTKTAEELALEMHKRMEEAEQQRLQRMKVVAEDAAKLSKGGIAITKGLEAGFDSLRGHLKSRVRNDDELDDMSPEALRPVARGSTQSADMEEDGDEEDDEEEEDDFGDDAFGQSESDEDEEDEEDEEDGEEDEEDEEDGEDDGEDEDEEEEDEGEEAEDEEEEEEEEEDRRSSKRRSRKRPAYSISAAVPSGDSPYEDMPHTLPTPTTLEALHDLIAKYCPGESWEDKTDALNELLQRIVQYNSPKLPGEAGAANQKDLQLFIPVLYKHWMRIGDLLSTSEQPTRLMQQLDRMSELLFSLTTDLSPARTCVITTRLLREIQTQWQKGLRRFALGEHLSSFPGLGSLLILALLGQMYSSSDLKHELLDPAKLLLGQMLTQCPVHHPGDVSKGLLVCTILMDYTKDSNKILPEVGAFLAQTLLLFASHPSKSTTPAPPSYLFSLATFQESLHQFRSALAQSPASALPSSHSSRLSWALCDPSASYSDAAAQILHTAFSLVENLLARYQSLSAFPELSWNVMEALRSLRPHAAPVLSSSWQKRTLELLERWTKMESQVRQQRQPLQWRIPAKAGIETKTPRYEVNYTFRKDQDTDKERIKLKQLTREFKREKKAAMRELRRDAAFLDNERFREKQQEQTSRREERVKNMAWLEEQQATLNQQVRKGKGLMELKGGGTGHLKALKKRMKR